jgi:putative DNA primase/helicase
MAGELAIEYGIVPWPKGDAIKAAAEMFDAWRAGRGTVANDEPRQILRRVSDFIDRHGDSRFSDKDACEPLKFGVKDRAGWWTRNDEGKLLCGRPTRSSDGSRFRRNAEGLGERGRTAASQREE